MDEDEYTRHIEALGKLFPKVFLKSADDFYGTEPDGNLGIWTGFGESGHYNYHECEVDKRLQKYVDDNDLFLEPHDAGTIMIWKG